MSRFIVIFEGTLTDTTTSYEQAELVLAELESELDATCFSIDGRFYIEEEEDA